MDVQKLLDLPGYRNETKELKSLGYWLNTPTADEIYDCLDYKRVVVIDSYGNTLINWDGMHVPQFNTLQEVFSDAMEAHQ